MVVAVWRRSKGSQQRRARAGHRHGAGGEPLSLSVLAWSASSAGRSRVPVAVSFVCCVWCVRWCCVLCVVRALCCVLCMVRVLLLCVVLRCLS